LGALPALYHFLYRCLDTLEMFDFGGIYHTKCKTSPPISASVRQLSAGHVRAGIERMAGGRYVLPDDEESGLAQQSIEVF
jgi:hypothetical protein